MASPNRGTSKSLDKPDEHITKGGVEIDVVHLGDLKFRRATYPKGWRFSTHMGADRCHDTHVGYTVSGQMSVELEDGTRLEFRPGSAFIVPAGHEAWVVGEEPCTIVQIDGGESAARRFNVEQRAASAA